MVNDDEVLDFLRDQIVEVSLGLIPRESVQSHSRLNEDLGLDSLDLSSVVLQLEDFAGVSLVGVDWRDIKTVNDLVRALGD